MSTVLLLLLLQAAGYATSFTPAKLVQAGGSGGAAWPGGMQDALLTGGWVAHGGPYSSAMLA